MRFSQSESNEPGINIAPLVDVIFLLVIFFAVSTTFLGDAALDLQLPTSSSQAEPQMDNIVLQLDADGAVAIGGETVERDALEGRLKSLLETAANKVVTLQADRATPHGEVVAIMDIVRESGASGLSVAARAGAQGER